MSVRKYTRGGKLIFSEKKYMKKGKICQEEAHSQNLFPRSASVDEKEISFLISFSEYFFVGSMTTPQSQSEMTCDLPLDLIKRSPGFSFDIGQ